MASNLLALSIKSVVPTGETKSDLSLVIPAEKKIKVEPLEVTVEVEQNIKAEEDQDVWATFHNTRIQLFVEDKLMIENDLKLNNKHVNFAQAVLRAQFCQCKRLQNILLQRWNATDKIVQIIQV